MTTDTQGGMNMNQILLWIGVLIVVLGGIYYFI